MNSFKSALRSLRRTPVLTTVVIVTLAVAIGANSAIFSVVNGVLLRPLGYPDDEQLVVLWGTNESESGEQFRLSPADYRDVRDNIEAFGGDRGDLLLVGWGGTHGAITSAVEEARRDGLSVSSIHLRHLNPFPSNLGDVLGNFDKVLIPELNTGQLTSLIRSKFLVDAQLLSKVQGQPFKVSEIRQRIDSMLTGDD